MNLKSASIMVTFGRKLPIGILLRIFANKAIYTLTRWYWFGKSLLLSLSNLILKDVKTY